MPKNLRPPFSLIRQAISHAQFDDKETRERVNSLIDDIEEELDTNQFEFVFDDTLQSIEALQEHLIELLQRVEEEEEHNEIVESSRNYRSSVSGGDLNDDSDDED